MAWINHLKVKFKIALLVVVAAVALIFISYNGYASLRRADMGMQQMASNGMKSVEYLSEARVQTRLLQVRAIQAIADPSRTVSLVQELPKDMQAYEDAWAQYKLLAVQVPETAAKLAAVDSIWQNYKQTIGRMGDLAAAGQREEALALYNAKGKDEMVQLRDHMNELQTIASSHADEMVQENAKADAAAIKNMIIITTVALLLLIMSTIWNVRAITRPLQSMMHTCRELKNGDFRNDSMVAARQDEFGEMANELMEMRREVGQLLEKIHTSAEMVAASSEELTASSQQSAQASTQVAVAVSKAASSTEQQQASVESGKNSVEKVNQTVAHIRTEAAKVTDNAAKAAQQAVKGNGSVDASVTQIKNVEKVVRSSAELVDRLGGRSQEIGQIVDTISGIAGQTNLLALNAAIEAARAGEQGRGFSVVAEEVRKLAEQSQTAAQQISAIIGGIQKDTLEAVAAMQEGREAVVRGAGSVEGLREVFQTISGLVEGVSSQVEKVDTAIVVMTQDVENITQKVEMIDMHGARVSEEMQSVSAATQEQSASAEEIASASDALAKLAHELQVSLQKFRF